MTKKIVQFLFLILPTHKETLSPNFYHRIAIKMFSVSDVQRIQKVVSASNIEQDALDILTVVRPLWKTALAEHGREIFTFRVLTFLLPQ